MRIFNVFIGAALALPLSASADCTAVGGVQRPQLIELFTSEGCSSCPPAEAWLNRLEAGARVVPLAFHVDYWDGPGWRDRFAQPGFAARQRGIAAGSKTQTYTPQVVLDGKVWTGWHRGGRVDAQSAMPASFMMRVRRSDLQVQWQSEPARRSGADDYKVFVALVEDGLQSHVRAGENAGKALQHDHVVRALHGPDPAANGTARLRARAQVDLDRARVVAWVQEARSGAVGQVLQVALADCGASPR
jgi:hypothetical protein